jgi:hypothetical protein
VGDSFQFGLFGGELRASADLHLIAYGEKRVRDDFYKNIDKSEIPAINKRFLYKELIYIFQ